MEPLRGPDWLRAWQQRALQERDLRESISSVLFDDEQPRLRSWVPAVLSTAAAVAGLAVAVWLFSITAPTTTSTMPLPTPTNAPADPEDPLHLGLEEGTALGRQSPAPTATATATPRVREPAPTPASPSARRSPSQDIAERTNRPVGERPPATTPPATPAPEKTREAEEPPEEEQPVASVEIEVVDEPVELEVIDERNAVLVSGVQEVGWRGSFTGAVLRVKVADGDDVRIWQNGGLVESGDGLWELEVRPPAPVAEARKAETVSAASGEASPQR